MSSHKVVRATEFNPVHPAIIIDVRTAMEHSEKRLKHVHLHAPLDTLDPERIAQEHLLDLDSEIYLLCRSGQRATQAAKKFIDRGYWNVHVIEGGLIACEAADHALEGHAATPKAPGVSHPLSLERQVRIAAGLFVVMGATLGLTVHPMFTLISLFVGGGLMFAGITDRCGLALVLAKMPWNKMHSACSAPPQTHLPLPTAS